MLNRIPVRLMTATTLSTRRIPSLRPTIPRHFGQALALPAPLATSTSRAFQSSCRLDRPSYSTGVGLSDQDYSKLSESTMDHLTEYLESHLEALPNLDPASIDIEYSSGVLTLKLGPDKGTYVINKQPPNKQIWLSSPISGPKRYDFDPVHHTWFYARDGSTLDELLNSELRTLLPDETFNLELSSIIDEP
ncbi:ferroxidase [Sporobolomyces koalae]|uniref:ferroxidase n=1 Tax=Sporobolomyces koalae TaxID=500713 RepID=UPI003178A70F